jgi:type II secretory pathway pseudopilin PulG
VLLCMIRHFTHGAYARESHKRYTGHMSVSSASSERSFTLLEILAVVAIIGLMAAIVFPSLSEARARARDNNRISTIRQIQRALELYFQDYNGYPPPAAYGEVPFNESAANSYEYVYQYCETYDSSVSYNTGQPNRSSKPVITPLQEGKYISDKPIDPVNKDNLLPGSPPPAQCNNGAGYHYFLYGRLDLLNEFPSCPNDMYVLMVSRFETGGNTRAERSAFWKNPGCSLCAGYDNWLRTDAGGHADWFTCWTN